MLERGSAMIAKAIKIGVLAALAGFALSCLSCHRPLPQKIQSGHYPIRIASWNVANLFDSVDDPGDDTVLSPEDFRDKVRRVAGVVDGLEADVVALEEVEKLSCLQALNKGLAKPFPLLGLIEGNDPRGIDVAFLSRVPIKRVVSHRDRLLPAQKGVPAGYRFSRDCLQVDLDTIPRVTIYINHFKSQLGPKKASSAKRRAQARGVVEILAEGRSSDLAVVVGDLNDVAGSWSLEPLEDSLEDVFKGWPSTLRATHRSRFGHHGLDHLLVSADGLSRVQAAKVWQNFGQSTSDHDPVSMELRLDRISVAPEHHYVWDGVGRSL